MAIIDLLNRAKQVKTETVELNNSSTRIGGLFEDTLNYVETILTGIYDVSYKIPLPAGQYYTATTARAAVPVSFRKKGLVISYDTSSTVYVIEEFYQGEVSAWTTSGNWKNNTSKILNAISLIDGKVTDEVGLRIAGDANLQGQINAVSAGSLGAIAYNDPAPTPGKNGYFKFSNGGSCTFITGGAVTVKAQDELSVEFTAPSTYVYKAIVIDNSQFVSKSAQSFTSAEKLQARKNTESKHEYQDASIVDAEKIPLPNIGWRSTLGVYTAQSMFYSSDLIPIVGIIYMYAPIHSNESVATVCFFNSSGVFISAFKARKIGFYCIDEFPATATQYTFTSNTDSRTYWCRNGVQQDLRKYINVSVNNLKVADPNLIDLPLTWVAGSYYSATTGNLVPQGGWNYTAPIDLSLISLAISGSYNDNGTVASVLYQRADGTFLQKDTNLINGTLYTDKILNKPYEAKYAILSCPDAAKFTAKSSTNINISDLPAAITPLYLAKVKKPTYNYFIDYNLFVPLNLKRWIDGDYNGLDSVVTATSLGLFSAYGFGKELNIVNSGSIGNKAILMIQTVRNELKVSNRINFHFFAVATVSGTYSIQLYNLNTSVKTIPLILTANVIQEVSFYYDFPNGYDWTTFSRLVLYSINHPSTSTLTVSPFEIWDGKLPQPSFTNQISLKESNILIDRSGFVGKRGLFIGDSISVTNERFWKGVLSTLYGFDYVLPIAGQLAPAQGGMPLYPHVTETTGSESIWYRCGGNRMSIYSFDKINLFGGTNDLNAGYNLGAATDTAYKDTNSRPGTLTWCAAFKGCIEMLQRDFPGIEIVICTVLDTSGYGNTMYDGTYNTREAMAIRQMQIAALYNLKCVPFFWMSGITAHNTPMMTADSIHPNLFGANGMAACYAATVGL